MKDLEAALRENDLALAEERRSCRVVELMIARMEIYKSMIHLLKQEQEYKEAA